MDADALIAKRYLTEQAIGRGGAGEVFRVRDKASGRTLALKRLAIDERHPRHADLALQFEREFHTLAQLAHPCIVAVHDYGVADGVPYYTMELLDGSDLRELSPLPWRRACALLCDVASSLGLLHSRRLVHRDLSPRNVRCTSDGRAKLLDFGAMAAMGRCLQVIGTPAYAAPELVNGQELDARSDLYGLGALAYFLLTGQHAFRVRTFRELRDVWRSRPLPPSTYARDIPPELDALVAALLSVDPAARPTNTAEVITRLRALSGLPAVETDATTHAYLTTPTLVGRSDELLAIRKRVLRAVRGSGCGVLIEGASGLGRSRMLATLVLEAKLAGALVLTPSSGASGSEEYRLLRQLVDALLEATPELARAKAHVHAERLARVLPALGLADVAPDGDVAEAIVQWLFELAGTQPLCIAVDDLARADAASVAVLARLAARAKNTALVVAATAQSDRPLLLQRALDQIADAGLRLALQPLDRAQSEALLRSVFGDVANVPTLAGFIHELAGGKPSACLELAQHLVDRGIARFADGAWSLPYRLDALSLPSSFEQAIELGFAALSPCARELAQLLSQVVPFAPCGLPELLELLEPRFAAKDVFGAIDELLRAQLVQIGSDDGYALRDATRRAVVERSIDAERKRALHALLARHYEQRSGCEAIATHHLLYAGEQERSLALYRALRGTITDITSLNSLFSRSDIGASLVEALYKAGRERGMAPAQLYPVLKVLVQLAAISDASLGGYADDALAQLCRDSGWNDWHAAPELPPLERVVQAIQRAQQRWESTPKDQRGLDPLAAIRELAVTVGILSGVYARVADSEKIARLPGLLEPFVPLSPVIALLHELAVGTVDGIVHASEGHVQRERVLVQLEVGPLDGLDELTRQGAVHLLHYYQGLDEAIRANPRALQRADRLGTLPTYAPLAWQVRALYFQSAGDIAAAERAREQRELHALQPFDNDGHLLNSMIYEAGVAARTGDIMTIKRLCERMAREAERFAGWKLWHAHCCAVFETLRGDPQAALREVARCRSLAPAVGHSALVEATSLEVELLVRIGEPARAVELGRRVLAERERLGRPLNNPLIFVNALALAETLTGDYARGKALLDPLIAEREASELGGLPTALLYAQRARIALCADDRAGFEQYSALAARASEQLRHPGLVARLQQLVSDARNADQPVSVELARGADLATSALPLSTALGMSVITQIGSAPGREQRAQHALELLVSEGSASGGHLLGITRGGHFATLASIVLGPPDPAVEREAEALLTTARSGNELATAIESTTQASAISEIVAAPFAGELHPFLLRSARAFDSAPVAIALLRASGSQPVRLSSELLSAVCDGLIRAGDLNVG